MGREVFAMLPRKQTRSHKSCFPSWKWQRNIGVYPYRCPVFLVDKSLKKEVFKQLNKKSLLFNRWESCDVNELHKLVKSSSLAFYDGKERDT